MAIVFDPRESGGVRREVRVYSVLEIISGLQKLARTAREVVEMEIGTCRMHRGSRGTTKRSPRGHA